MKLRQLECLCTVVDAEFNISRAAVLLHATQPAVSKQLKLLEEELGLDLLHRYGGRAVGLTDAGERTVAWARRALQSVENIRGLTRENQSEAGGTIVVASSHAHAKYVLVPVLQRFKQRHPRVRVVFDQAWAHEVIEFVREGKATMGVVSLAQRPPPADVVTVPFRSWPLLVLAPAGHALLEAEDLTLQLLVRHPLILSHASPLADAVQAEFDQAGLDPDVSVRAINADMTQDCVQAGIGIGIVPAFTWDPARHPGLQARDASHLFRPVVSSVVLRRNSHLPHYAYDFLAGVDASLHRDRLEPLIFDRG